MSAGWSCPHNQNDQCAIRPAKPCQPGYPGCVLFGKIRFADPNHPANKALDAIKEKDRKQR
ncbi:hypothetical protein LGV61_03095 [Desulfurispirillum indicum]|uniref:Uncharacterized protein n=1 Tax=Desulfurispirillum indicum (strain ATCC BAA-1389 / DSM 22839 / S5) TaxID=653733 RepID=E6W1D3_DESIS|nr:hypothetical protein [Desulfurispirillum indicum]ADU65389.1 hypothetical protein Selin_0641 [Desulfurispirillum indicum S5]UCZ57282.1 hypothetical protein LGV61_03095 [Desulfurispirillum indicum]